MALWIVAALAAYFVKGLCGFANTLVFSSILAFGTTNANISPVELMLGIPTNIILTWKNRSKLKRSVYLPLAALVLLGLIPGAFLLKNLDARFVKVIFGAVVILVGIEIYLRDIKGWQFRESRAVTILISLLSGLLCGLFGVGVLLAACVSRMTDSSEAFKANFCAVNIIENTCRLILYSALGIITLSAVKTAAMLFPFMLAGLFAGMKSSAFLNEKTAKKLVILLLILSGVMMIVENL